MKRARILVVEDERIVAEDIKRSLSHAGYEVVGMVASGKDALLEVKEAKPDLVLMDIVLKGEISGIEAADRIHQEFDLPVVYLTAYADTDTLEKAKVTEPFGYILKPFDNRELASTIEMALYKHAIDKRLRQSEAWFSTTLKSIGDGVIVTDREGKITFMNVIAESLTGWKQKAALGKPLMDVYKLVDGETGAAIASPVPDILKSKSVIGLRADSTLITKGDKRIPIDDSAAPIKDDRGSIIGVVLVFHDIIERKLAEEALRESEDRYRRLFEESRDAIYVAKRNGQFLISNQSTLDLFGYTRNEIQDLNIQAMYVNPDDRKAFQTEIEAKGSVRDYEVQLRNKKGETLDCLLTSTLLRDKSGKVLGYQGIIRDITERKKAEEYLRRSESRYRLLAENVTDVIWTMDMDLQFTDVTPSIQQILDYTIEDFLALSFTDILTEESYQALRESFPGGSETIKRAVGEAEEVSDIEVELKKKNDSRVWVNVSLTMLKNDAGEAIGILGVAHDITRRKRVEADREKIQAQLLQAQKMEAVGILAGGVAHDFNNLLTIIQGNAELAMMKTGPLDPLFSDINEIKAAARRASDLTNQLLLFSRKQPMQFIQANLNKTIEDLLKMLHRLIGEDVGISTDLEKNIWTVQADRGTLEQVIMNLSINARDAMPDGGRLLIRTENVELNNSAITGRAEIKSGKFVRLSIRDTGIGMDAETVAHIFEPFFSTKDPGEGTGLGLSVVYGIVDQHGGWIDVDSTPGEGTMFLIYLPATAEESAETEDKMIQMKELRGQGEGILIVEDAQGVLDYASAVLKENGYTVYPAKDAAEAMAIFKKEEQNILLVLADVVLPDRNGIELVEDLIKLKSGLKIILCSGYTGMRSQWELIQEKGYKYIQKPYGLQELLSNVKMIIDQE